MLEQMEVLAGPDDQTFLKSEVKSWKYYAKYVAIRRVGNIMEWPPVTDVEDFSSEVFGD